MKMHEEFDLPRFHVEGEKHPEQEKTPFQIDFELLLKERDRLKDERRALFLKSGDSQKKWVRIVKSKADFLFPGSTEDQARYLEERATGVLKQVVERLKTETSINEESKEFVDVGRIPDIQEFMREQGMRLANRASAYSPATGSIVIDEWHVNKSALKTLSEMSNGMPLAFWTIFHELIHSKQEPKITAWSRGLSSLGSIALLGVATEAAIMHSEPIQGVAVGLTGIFMSMAVLLKMWQDDKMKKPLYEMQAYRAENHFSTGTYRRAKYLLNGIAQSYGFDNPKQMDRCVAASVQVDRLRALDVSHGQIADLVKEAKWNTKALVYDTLEKKIEDVRAERGLSIEEVDSLVDARNIRRDIDMLKLTKIVFEEIEKDH